MTYSALFPQGVTTPLAEIALPPEPCVAISDGDLVIVATDRTCEPLRQWGQSVGPVARAITVARLRAFADQIEKAGEADA